MKGSSRSLCACSDCNQNNSVCGGNNAIYHLARGSDNRLDGHHLSSTCLFGYVGESKTGTSENMEHRMFERHNVCRGHVGRGIVKNQVDPELDDEGHIARPK